MLGIVCSGHQFKFKLNKTKSDVNRYFVNAVVTEEQRNCCVLLAGPSDPCETQFHECALLLLGKSCVPETTLGTKQFSHYSIQLPTKKKHDIIS